MKKYLIKNVERNEYKKMKIKFAPYSTPFTIKNPRVLKNKTFLKTTKEQKNRGDYFYGPVVRKAWEMTKMFL